MNFDILINILMNFGILKILWDFKDTTNRVKNRHYGRIHIQWQTAIIAIFFSQT